MSARVVVKGLVRAFGETRAVDDLTFSVGEGEVFGLLGHNGAGKTTTVRLVCGVLERDRGDVTVLGLDPKTDGDRVRARIGVLTETPSHDERFTAREALVFFAALHGLSPSETASRVDELLAFFDLSASADARVATFSKGMKQKLAVARALLARPEVLFLDEPTSGLDPVSARKLTDRVAHLARAEGCAVVYTTHRLVEAAVLCARVAILQKGRVVVEGAPRDIVARAGVARPLHLEVDDVARAHALLAPHVGDRARIVKEALIVDDVARDGVPDLLARLVAGGVRVFDAHREEATLEDAYLALHGHDDDGRAGGAS